MGALRQVFRDDSSTSGTPLTCLAWVNSHTTPSSVCSFVRRKLDELIPGGILNALGKAMVFDHAPDIQILENYQTEQGDQSVTELMGEVAATVSYPLMDARPRFALLLPLRFRQSLLVRAKESRILNLLAGRERGERRESNIHADGIIVCGEWSRLNFHRETRIPLARRRARDRERLNSAFNRAVELDPHVPDFRQTQLAVSHREAGLRVGEGIVALARAKAREARLAVTLSHPAKEVLKCLIESAENILQHLAMNVVKFGASFFDFRQLVSLFGVANRLAFKAVCIVPFLQSRVVKFAAKREGIIQASGLRLARVDAIAKTSEYDLFSHAAHVPTVKGTVRSQESSPAATDFVPQHSTNQLQLTVPRFIPAIHCGVFAPL